MRWDLGMRRVTPGLFVLALIALLVVPVGSAARPTHHPTSAGPTQSKTAITVARTHQAAAHVDVSDRFQLDPTTPPDELDAPEAVTTPSIDLSLESYAEGHGRDPAVR